MADTFGYVVINPHINVDVKHSVIVHSTVGVLVSNVIISYPCFVYLPQSYWNSTPDDTLHAGVQEAVRMVDSCLKDRCGRGLLQGDAGYILHDNMG